uniref:BTB domain-containing protein n=1 Tax=Trichobilharzia regenti TaxID=157069 RepID=A0AA85J7A0_TRIRE|nr:unnamed protein product [Trichobilharzia regenti]
MNFVEIIVTEDNVQTLLPAADFLLMRAVREKCCEFLESHLHVSNCLGIRKFAVFYNCSSLRRSCESFIIRNVSEVLKTEEFTRLNPDELLEFASIFASNIPLRNDLRAYAEFVRQSVNEQRR